MKKFQSSDIAIIGISALFPGSKDKNEYWSNIVNNACKITDAGDDWCQNYYEKDSKLSNRINNKKGGFIGDISHFDPLKYGIMPNSIDGGEPDHFLALKIAHDALADAGYIEKEFDKKNTGIILGRGTYINRGYNTLLQHGQIIDQTIEILRKSTPQLNNELENIIRKELQESLPPFNAEMAPGLVPNVITGRIANRLDLMGPNYIVDGACASSLIAVDHAIYELNSGRCNMVIAGGVHASTPPQINMIFCQLGALSDTTITPFSDQADGTLLSEGLGMVVLKRLEDAEADNDRIYAVIKGTGTASDGRGLGLLAPKEEGEILALERAYKSANVDPETIGLIEAHGTGIPLGDKTEIRSLSAVLGSKKASYPSCAIGSVKSIIGHTIPAAGIASLIKASLSLYYKVIPPTLCESINPDLKITSTRFYINTEVKPWVHSPLLPYPRRAGVNAFGFGGINAHAILEEYSSAQDNKKTSASANIWPFELFLIHGDSWDDVKNILTELNYFVENNQDLELRNLSYTLSKNSCKSHRIGFVANSISDLQKKLNQSLQWLTSSDSSSKRVPKNIFANKIGERDNHTNCFIFPGEGSQYSEIIKDLAIYFPRIRKWLDILDSMSIDERDLRTSQILYPAKNSIDKILEEQISNKLFAMDYSSEIVFITSLALNYLLEDFGVPCDSMIGHSSGENTALVASGLIPIDGERQLIDVMSELNSIYKDCLTEEEIATGHLLACGGLNSDTLQYLLSEYSNDIFLAMDNCPNQKIIFCTSQIYIKVQKYLGDNGVFVQSLPFNRAYHTPLFGKVASAFKDFYESFNYSKVHKRVFSCYSMAEFPDDRDSIVELAVNQWTNTVNFAKTIDIARQAGIDTFIEVGPSSNLTNFIKDIYSQSEISAYATNHRNKNSLLFFLELIAKLAIRHDLNLNLLYEGREVAEINFKNSDIVTSKRDQLLDLNMPIMKLSDQTAKKLYDSASSLSKNRLSQSFTDTNDSSSIKNVYSKSVSYDDQFETIDTSHQEHSSIIHEHNKLMSSFLVSENNIMNLMAASLSNQDAKAEAETYSQSNDIDHNNYPLLGSILEYNNSEAVFERKFSIDKDYFLIDHTLGSNLSVNDSSLIGLPVIPFTISMEIISEAADFVCGGNKKVREIRNIRGYRWLAIDEDCLALTIKSKIHSSNEIETFVEAKIFQHNPDSKIGLQLVFEGTVVCSNSFEDNFKLESITFPDSSMKSSRWKDDELYKTGMFHGPRFQGVKRINSWSKEGIDATLQVISTNNFFKFTNNPKFRLDSGLIDAAGQLVGYWVSEQFGTDFNVFPFSVKSFTQFVDILPDKTYIICKAKIKFISDRQTTAYFEFIDQSGKLIACLEGWEDRYFDIPNEYYKCRLNPSTAFISSDFESDYLYGQYLKAFPDGFLEDSWKIWMRVLAHLVLSKEERTYWYTLSSVGHQKDWLMGRIVAKNSIRKLVEDKFSIMLSPVDISILNDENGKPFIECSRLSNLQLPNISISHHLGSAVAISSLSEQPGVDILNFKSLSNIDNLSIAFSDEELHYLKDFDSLTTLCAFSAKECIFKCLPVISWNPLDFTVVNINRSSNVVQVDHSSKSYYVNYLFKDENIITTACH